MMNKYQKAIGSLRWSAELCNLCDMDDVDTLQELVDKATPKKVKVIDYNFGIFECPHCRSNIYWGGNKKDHKHCLRCGQALDWSEE